MGETYIPSDRDPLPSGLLPAERIALTVARAQLERGDNPTHSVTAVLVMTIDRLLLGGESRPYTLTRDELAAALSRIEVRPVNGKVVAEWMADAILEELDDAGKGARP